MTFRTLRPSAVAVATLGVTLLAVPARASSITIDDTLANNTVQWTYSDVYFASAVFTGTCTTPAGNTATAGSANCTEASSSTLTLVTTNTIGTGGGDLKALNVYDVGGTLSDTLVLNSSCQPGSVCTTGTVPPGIVDASLTFQSGTSLTAIPGGMDIVGEGTFVAVLGKNQFDPITLTVITATPEPTSLLLLGTGIVTLAGRRFRRRRSTHDSPI